MDYQLFAQTYLNDQLRNAEKIRQISEINKYKKNSRLGLMKYTVKLARQIGLVSYSEASEIKI